MADEIGKIEQLTTEEKMANDQRRNEQHGTLVGIAPDRVNALRERVESLEKQLIGMATYLEEGPIFGMVHDRLGTLEKQVATLIRAVVGSTVQKKLSHRSLTKEQVMELYEISEANVKLADMYEGM